MSAASVFLSPETDGLQAVRSPSIDSVGARLAPFTCPTDVSSSRYLSSVCPASGRGVVVFAPKGRAVGVWVQSPAEGLEFYVDTETGEVLRERSLDERAAGNLERADRRARSKMKDYVVANDIGMLWTFTYAGSNRPDHTERKRVVGDVHEFVKRWRKAVGKQFPYIYVLEQHKDGHLHVHLGVPYFFFPHDELMRLWGHGGVNFSKRAKGSSKRDRLRLAGYLTKYISKQVGEHHEQNDHRYEVGRGFSPARHVAWWFSLVEADTALGVIGFEMVWYPDPKLDGSTNPNAPPFWVYSEVA